MDLNLPLIIVAGFIAASSPGPATIAIAGTSMASGRSFGVALASGTTTASWTWSTLGAFGFSALMFANVWIFEAARYMGAGYLLFLALKSARSALRGGGGSTAPGIAVGSLRAAYVRGLVLHLGNPKAILFFGSLYTIAMPPGASWQDLVLVICILGVQSAIVFHGYAFLFSSRVMARGYLRLRRWFDAVFAIAFGAASLKILTARLD